MANNVLQQYDEVQLNVNAGSTGTVFVTFTNVNGEDGKDLYFELSKEQIKWLRIGLKQAYELAFK